MNFFERQFLLSVPIHPHRHLAIANNWTPMTPAHEYVNTKTNITKEAENIYKLLIIFTHEVIRTIISFKDALNSCIRAQSFFHS